MHAPIHEIAGMAWPFDLYEDYEGAYHVIDARTRIVLDDTFAYDRGDIDIAARKPVAHERMMEIVRALNRQLGPVLVADAATKRIRELEEEVASLRTRLSFTGDRPR